MNFHTLNILSYLFFLFPTIPAQAPSLGELVTQLSEIVPLVGDLAGTGTPPLMTTDHSPECLNVNQGTIMCCEETLNGGNLIVTTLSSLAGYKLSDDVVNGIECTQTSWCAAPSMALCCQVTTLTPVLGMWCAPAPGWTCGPGLQCDPAPTLPDAST